MGRKKGNLVDRQAELLQTIRIQIEVPADIFLDEREESAFQGIIGHRAPTDWTPYEVRQACELAQLEVQAADLWQAMQLLGCVEQGTNQKKGGPSAEANMFNMNFSQRMTLKRFLKLATPKTNDVLHAHSTAMHRTAAITDAVVTDDDDSLLAH